MKINVIVIPSCTWVLEDTSFYCSHDDFEIVDRVEDYMDLYGHNQREYKAYQCADPDCEEPLEGSPEEDAFDPDWEYENQKDE